MQMFGFVRAPSKFQDYSEKSNVVKKEKLRQTDRQKNQEKKNGDRQTYKTKSTTSFSSINLIFFLSFFFF